LALGVAVNESIDAAGEEDAVRLVLSQSGSVIGRLVRADRESVVSGGEVLLAFSSVSGLPGRALSTSDQNGAFRFDQVALGSFQLESIHTGVNGIARGNGELTSNGELFDFGDLILDESDPVVLEVTPTSGSDQISTTVSVELLFSEPLDGNRIDQKGIYLQGIEGVVSADIRLLADDDGLARRVTLSPRSPLVSEQSYQVVVIDDRRLSPTGGLLGLGPVDLVGRPLVVPFISTFTTADNDPPVLLSASPENGAIQVDPRAVVRLSFNEPIQEQGIQLEVGDDSAAIAGSVSVGSAGQVLVFTPLVPLKVNQSYRYTISGIRDLAGNLMIDQPLIGDFRSLDTIGPRLGSLAIDPDRVPIAGTPVDILASLLVAETDVTVRFLNGFELLGEVSEAPYRIPLSLPETGALVIRATAFDRFGNEGPIAELPIEPVKNQGPKIQFSRVDPLEGSVLTGSTFILDVSATDDSEVTELRAIASGAVESQFSNQSGAQIRLEGQVPGDTGPGQRITIFAEATDDSGISSGEVSFELPVADGTRPTVTILSSEGGGTVRPGDDLVIQFQAADNFGVVEWRAELFGAVVASFNESFPSTLDLTETIEIQIPDETPADGAVLGLQLRVVDAADNRSLPSSLSLRMIDEVAPEVVSILPLDGAQGVEILPVLSVSFSEPIDAGTVDEESVHSSGWGAMLACP